MFSYDATFDLCTADPTAPDLAATCADALNAAYVLKRAVAWAVYTCQPESIAACAAPFEAEGLPAVAARIAVDTGCDATDIATWPQNAPLLNNHCVAVASDIMIDEGVVPVFAEITCGLLGDECRDLHRIHATLWLDAVLAMSDSDLTQLRLTIAGDDCTASDIDFTILVECDVDRLAEIWANLAQQTEQEN